MFDSGCTSGRRNGGQSCFVFLVVLLACTGAGLAQSRSDLPQLQASDFTSSEECGSCHKGIFEQWRTSMHSKSFTSPLYRSVVERLVSTDGAKHRYFCLSCHTPVGSVGGEAFRIDLPINWDEMSGIAAEGVTCDFCHTISGKEMRGQAIATGSYLFPRRGTTATKYGVHADASSEAHQVETSEFLASAEFCSTCHSFKHPVNSIEIQNTFTEWQSSLYPAQGVRCQDCHMPRFTGNTAEGAREREDLHAHYFDRARLVTQAASLDIQASLSRSTLDVETRITNSGAGHSIPTGVPGLRNLVLTVEVLNASYEGLATQETNFRQLLLNDRGEEQLPWQDVKVIRDERIPAGETVSKRMSFPLPASINGTVRIHARLHLQGLSPYWARELGLEPPEPILMAERVQTIQVP